MFESFNVLRTIQTNKSNQQQALINRLIVNQYFSLTILAIYKEKYATYELSRKTVLKNKHCK